MGNFSKRYLPTADELVEYLRAFATEYALKIDYNQNVVRVWRADPTGPFSLKTAAGATRCLQQTERWNDSCKEKNFGVTAGFRRCCIRVRDCGRLHWAVHPIRPSVRRS